MVRGRKEGKATLVKWEGDRKGLPSEMGEGRDED